MKDKIKENQEKIKMNKILPHLVSNVIEVFHHIISNYFSVILFRLFHCIWDWLRVRSRKSYNWNLSKFEKF